MNLGLKHEKTMLVTEEWSAKAMGSGTLAVFATPAMVALMEGCAAESVSNLLEKGITTVGIQMTAEHLSATPLGMQVCCKSTLIRMEGRKLTFSLEVFDEAGLIGRGTHERFMVEPERFLEKANAKLKNN